MVANTLTTLSSDSAAAPRINAVVWSSSALMRMFPSGTCLSCRRADRGDARPRHRARPVSATLLRGRAGVVLHRALERYGPATRLIEPVQLAATPLSR